MSTSSPLRRESYAVDRGQVFRDALPRFPLVLGDPQRTGCAPEGKSVAGRVDVESMSVGEIVGVVLRKSVAQNLVTLTAVARPGDHHLAVRRQTMFVLHALSLIHI